MAFTRKDIREGRWFVCNDRGIIRFFCYITAVSGDLVEYTHFGTGYPTEGCSIRFGTSSLTSLSYDTECWTVQDECPKFKTA